MINLICSSETASHNIASAIIPILGLEESESIDGMECLSAPGTRMIRIRGRLVDADFLDRIVDGPAVFLSRHSSNKGIPAFTVHAQGNWSEEAALGGKPRTLGMSSPSMMLNALKSISAINKTGIQNTYEATHHGPLLNSPSFFVELGGNADVVSSADYALLIARAVADSFEDRAEYGKVAIGIGGMHYPSKFTRLALDGTYAFSHIMPKYYADRIDMIESAISRSDIKAEVAVIEWKGIKAADREDIIGELNRLGIDYAKV